MHDKYVGMTPEAFETMCKRNKIFQESLNDVTKEPIKVFNSLSKRSIEELHLIREISKDLQKKKEEDMLKAAQIAEEGVTEEKAEDKTEDIKAEEEKKPEAEK